MSMRPATIARAYRPWYRRRAQWWMILGVLLLSVVVVVVRWPYWQAVVAVEIYIVVIYIIDYLLTRHIRLTHPRPE